MSESLPRVAIIGAGIAGLSLARLLGNQAEVTLFEKSRGVGGRMATRYADQYQFDHGAQYFTARSKAFKAFLKPLLDQGIVQAWQPRVLTLALDEQGELKKSYKRDWFEPHYVAAPKMNRLGKVLAEGLNVELHTQLTELVKIPEGWLLKDTQGREYGAFDWVISTAPAPQTAALLPNTFAGYSTVQSTEMAGCFSLMLGLQNAPAVNWQAAVVKDSCISWIAIDSSKPGRGEPCCLLVHTSNEWAEQHLEDDPQAVEQYLLDELQRLVRGQSLSIDFKQLHRWRYASTIQSDDSEDNSPACLFDEQLQLGVCADWLMDGHVESAFLSAKALSEKIMSRLNRNTSI